MDWLRLASIREEEQRAKEEGRKEAERDTGEEKKTEGIRSKALGATTELHRNV